jgi:hypothetical protein
MSEELPEHLKKKLLEKYMKKIVESQRRIEERREERVDPEKIVWSKLADEKARELMYKAKKLYPQLYPYAIKVFYELLKSGKVDEFDGYLTLLLLNRLGIPVKPDIRLKFVKHGKEVSFKEYAE